MIGYFPQKTSREVVGYFMSKLCHNNFSESGPSMEGVLRDIVRLFMSGKLEYRKRRPDVDCSVSNRVRRLKTTRRAHAIH